MRMQRRHHVQSSGIVVTPNAPASCLEIPKAFLSQALYPQKNEDDVDGWCNLLGPQVVEESELCFDVYRHSKGKNGHEWNTLREVDQGTFMAF